MKTILCFVTLALLSSTQLSCTKEKVVYATPADEISQELQQIIKDRQIQRVFAVEGNNYPGISANGGSPWSFSNGFIMVNNGGANVWYNLATLRYYQVQSVGTSINALVLYFP